MIVALDGLQDPGNAGTVIRCSPKQGLAQRELFFSCISGSCFKQQTDASKRRIFCFAFHSAEYVEREELLKQAADVALPLYTLTAFRRQVDFKRKRSTSPAYSLPAMKEQGASISCCVEQNKFPFRCGEKNK